MRSRFMSWATIVFTGFLFPLIDTAAIAKPFDRFFGFGDSTIDSGWFIYQPRAPGVNGTLYSAAVASGGGKPTTPNGLMVSERLAAHFGLAAFPADRPGGGTNYAASGAQSTDAFINPHAPPTVNQINSYLASVGGIADSRALYLISSGGNDVKYAGNQLSSGAFTLPQAQNYVISAATNLANAIKLLENSGARYIIVATGSELVPEDPAFSIAPLGLNSIYGSALSGTLTADGVHFIPTNRGTLSAEIGTDPAAFGLQFTFTSEPACINPSPATISNSWALYCTPALLVAPDAATTHLWADDEHYTAAGQKFLADYYISLVDALLDACEDQRDDRPSWSFGDDHRDAPAPASICNLWRAPGSEKEAER
jgi:outer membrane lipase/esterase